MATLVDTTPILPRPIYSPPNLDSLAKYDATLNMALFQSLIKIAYRLNLALVRDGSEAMDAPLPLASYTVVTVPDATLYTGSVIYVSDETGGPTVAFSDGTNWRRVQDRNVVS